MGDSGVAILANQLVTGGTGAHVQSLDLFSNHVTDDGAISLSAALSSHGCSLQELYLWGNDVGNVGASSLAQALELNNKLEALVLWNNKISDVGADALIKMLETNLVLKKLYLTGNEISKDRIAQVKQKLNHESLKERKIKAKSIGLNCIVDKYSEWSVCEGKCGIDQGIKHRTRVVIQPQQGEGKKCPPLEEVQPCVTAPCPKDPLQDFLTTCKILEPEATAETLREVLGANIPSDLFELDSKDIIEVGLKVAQRKKLIRCICDESEDRAPCCDGLKGRHHASVDELMTLTQVVRKGDVIAQVGDDCEGALGLYEEALGLSKNMAAHNFYGEISYKIFLVKTRCSGMRTPSLLEMENCGTDIEILSDAWLIDDFRRGVSTGWSTLTLNSSALSSKQGYYKDKNTQFLDQLNREDETSAVNTMMKQVMPGIHWSSWYRLFKTSSEDCNKFKLDSEWSKLMLRYNSDESYRHSWTMECANLASLLVSAGRDLIYEWTPCGDKLIPENQPSHDEGDL